MQNLKLINSNVKVLKLFAIVLVALVSSCAIQQTPLNSQLTKTTQESIFYTLSDAILVKVPNAKSIQLKADAKWKKVGYIEQGDVFSSTDQAVVIEGFNVYEGYIVVHESALVGFYLPFEKSFIEINPTSIQFNKEPLDEN